MDSDLLEKQLDRSKRRVAILERMIEDQMRDLFVANVELAKTGDYTDRLIESMMDSLLVLSPAGSIVRINSATSAILGYEPEELIGKPLGIVVEGEEATPHQADSDELLAHLMASGIIGQREKIYLAKDGTRIPVLFSGSAILDREGGTEAIVCIARDITERKQAEEYITALLQASPVGILVAGEDGIIELVNDELVKLFGYSQGELMGKPIEVLVPERFREEHRENVRGFVESATNRPMGVGRDIFGRRKDGSEVAAHIGLASTQLMGRGVVVAGVLDRTDYVKTEEQRRRLEVESARLAGMSEVATGVLHNVGNVVNSVNISAGIVQQGMQGSSLDLLERVVDLFGEHSGDSQSLLAFITGDPRGRRFSESLSSITEYLIKERSTFLSELDSMQTHVRHIMAIIDSQQEFARTTVGVSERINLKSFLQNAVALSGLELDSNEYQVQCQCESNLYLNIDVHKLMQILVNLLGNARHAVSGDKINERIILIRAHRRGTEVVIEVADHGVGISRENLARVFEHGYTTKVDGHGFGLHMCATAAMDLGGSLVANSDGPGRGATFTISIPHGRSRQNR